MFSDDPSPTSEFISADIYDVVEIRWLYMHETSDLVTDIVLLKCMFQLVDWNCTVEEAYVRLILQLLVSS